MSTAACTLHSVNYDAAASLWSINATIVSADGSVRSGPEVVALPESATPEQLQAALISRYES